MYGELEILAIVPARGGSKGVPRKNIHPLLGKPLVGHVAAVAAAVPDVDMTVVSTDDAQIAATARQAGLQVPFERPAELAGDLVGDHEVLVHALAATEEVCGSRFDVVLMLQPTSPLRRPEHLRGAIHKLVDEGWDAVWSVSPTDSKYHPRKQLTIGEGDGMHPYEDQIAVVPRQHLSRVYHRNGAVYAFTRQCLLEQGTIFGAATAALLINEPMVSIDTLEDFARVEDVLRSRRS